MKQIASFPALGAFGDQTLDRMWGSVPMNQNYAYSDLALYIALSATYLGASGESAKELRSLLHLNGKDDLKALRPIMTQLIKSGVFSIETKVSVGKNVPLLPPFEEQVRGLFGSEIVASAEPNFLDLMAHLTLDAQWQKKFNPMETKPAGFQRLDGSSVTVSMMNQKKQMPYGKDNEFTWVVLGHVSKHQQTQAPVLMLFLPTEGMDFQEAGRLLTQARIQKAYERSDDSDKVILSLPRVFFDSVVSVSKLFNETELKHCYSDQANFGEASNVVLKIQDVHLGVSQSWDEFGQKVETVARVRGACLGMPSEQNMEFSRPFYEVLYDPDTQLVLLRGRIVDPPAAGSQRPGRVPAEFQGLLGAPRPELALKITEFRERIADLILSSFPAVDLITVGRYKEIKTQLGELLGLCDSKTLSQIYGFMYGPLANALNEYAERMKEVVHLVERWRRIEDLRVALVEKKQELQVELGDLKELLKLLLSESSYPEPTLYCFPQEGLNIFLKSFENENDPAKLIALFQEPHVADWIEIRTKHYMQELRYRLAIQFEPSSEMKERFEKDTKKVLNLRAAAKLSPNYFRNDVTGRSRLTYEFGFQGPISLDWGNILNPHYLVSGNSIFGGERSVVSYALKEQYSLIGEPNGACKRELFQRVMREGMVFNLPWKMQLFLRDVWSIAPAQQRLIELYARAHELVNQQPLA